MSNEIKTRRLIVSFPALSGEEADIAAEQLAEVIPIRLGRSTIATVNHVREGHVPGFYFNVAGDSIVLDAIEQDDRRDHATFVLTPLQARQLAGTLLDYASLVDGQEA